MTKKDVIKEILLAYKHDVVAEGTAISKRRLWYILKPQFEKADLTGIMAKGKQVAPITNADYSLYYNALAKEGVIDDSYIEDSSRKVMMGTRLPHIIIATEKDTITSTASILAQSLGVSLYVMGGFSSIYASKKFRHGFGSQTILVLSDFDKSGMDIQNTAKDHFPNASVHRPLLWPEQVPEEKKDDFYKIVKGEKWYELDVLNIGQLQNLLLENIPEDVANEIKDSYEDFKHTLIMDSEVDSALWDDAEYRQIDKRMDEIRDRYESAFMKAKPIRFSQYNIQDIHYNRVQYKVDPWY